LPPQWFAALAGRRHYDGGLAVATPARPCD